MRSFKILICCFILIKTRANFRKGFCQFCNPSTMDLKIGVLAIQGGFSEHECALLKCQNSGVLAGISVKVCRVTQALDVPGLDGLVIPGGESSVNCHILDDAIMNELCNWANDDKHVLFGTCAGLITLSKSIENTIAGQHDRFSKVTLVSDKS